MKSVTRYRKAARLLAIDEETMAALKQVFYRDPSLFVHANYLKVSMTAVKRNGRLPDHSPTLCGHRE